ncbi:MAG: penicillin-binding protein 2 [Acidobacteriota bacterium]|nr:penicillin-binding protein 2 [Acidobacteriota bacterium]
MRSELEIHGDDRRDNMTLPLVLLRTAVVLAFAALAVGFWRLQVVQHDKYHQLAENNHQRTLGLRARRGMVFDRDGRVLVENRNSLNISLVREQVDDLDSTIALLSEVAGVPGAALQSVVDRSRRAPAYQPIVLIRDATIGQVSAVAAHALEMPGLFVQELPARYYPAAEVAAHLFGYVGEVSDAQLASAEFDGVRSGAVVGKSGIESTYNALLTGKDGARQVVVDAIGREVDTMGETAPAEGRQLKLTLDYDLQEAAEAAFKVAGFDGAAVVLDPRSGEILSLVSLPAYDPNAFAMGIDSATWTGLNDDTRRPLNNRALQGRYSPGSTFKIAMAVAALEEGVVDADERVTCNGGGTFYGRFYQCWGTHGSVDMREALERSCNTYFYTLGQKMEVDQIHKWATALGLGVMSGIDLPHEVQGLVPSTAWKREARGEPWYPGETISVAIGQGAVGVTPLSLAVMMATVVNGGTRVTPHLLKAVNDGDGWVPAQPPGPRSQVQLSPETLRVVTDGLWRVVNGQGTGGRGRIEGRDVIGKTGTAQVISLKGRAAIGETDPEFFDHGWFVFAAPAHAPEIAGVVFGEHNEHGSLSAPIAKHVMETYFAKQEGRPLPVLPLPATPQAVPLVTAVAATGN